MTFAQKRQADKQSYRKTERKSVVKYTLPIRDRKRGRETKREKDRCQMPRG